MAPSLYPLGHKLKESYSLSATETLILARQLGVELVLSGAGLRAIGSRDAITELAPHIAACKAELLRLLIEPTAPTPAKPPIHQPRNLTREEKAARFADWVATWQPLAIAYHAHHFNCPVCKAAGKRHGERGCEAGASLWRAYQDAVPTDPPR